jgi:hypothetical protein
MKENYFLGFYWGSRRETAEQCIMKIYDTFNCLIEFDSSFDSWYLTSKQKKNEDIFPIDISKSSIEKLLLKGVHRDAAGAIISDLGHLFSLKSEKKYATAHLLSFTCGSYDDSLTNCVTMEIKGSKLLQINSKDAIMLISNKLSEIWNPEKKVIQSENKESI